MSESNGVAFDWFCTCKHDFQTYRLNLSAMGVGRAYAFEVEGGGFGGMLSCWPNGDSNVLVS